MPAATRARWRAAVPDPTETAWSTPRYSANRASKASTISPPTKRPEARMRPKAASSSAAIGLFTTARSTKGTDVDKELDVTPHLAQPRPLAAFGPAVPDRFVAANLGHIRRPA